jgi:hypothetical protein
MKAQLYPATAFEQGVLKAVRELNGRGDDKTITKKLTSSGWSNVTVQNVRWTLSRLDSIGYVSPLGEEDANGMYQIEVFGERALASEPVLDPSALEKRKMLAFLAFAINNLNYFFLGVTWLNRPLLFALCLAVAWLFAGSLQMYRIAKMYSKLPATGKG